MRSVDAAYPYRQSRVVCVSACLLVTTVNPAKTDEPIEMAFRTYARLGPRNHEHKTKVNMVHQVTRV